MTETTEENKQCGNPDEKSGLIECRKYTPKFLSNPDFNAIGAWPLIPENCWCGQFKPSNSKGEA